MWRPFFRSPTNHHLPQYRCERDCVSTSSRDARRPRTGKCVFCFKRAVLTNHTVPTRGTGYSTHTGYRIYAKSRDAILQAPRDPRPRLLSQSEAEECGFVSGTEAVKPGFHDKTLIRCPITSQCVDSQQNCTHTTPSEKQNTETSPSPHAHSPCSQPSPPSQIILPQEQQPLRITRTQFHNSHQSNTPRPTKQPGKEPRRILLEELLLNLLRDLAHEQRNDHRQHEVPELVPLAPRLA